LCEGMPFDLFWNTGGNFVGEVGITVVDAFGEIIFTKPPGTGAQGTLLFSDVVNCTPPTCPRPVSVAIGEINMNDVEISWVEAGSATTWGVIVQPLGSGYPDGTEPEIITTTDNPYIYTGLTAATQYEVYVRAVCAPDDLSDWRGPVAFDTTICDAVDQCLYTFNLTDTFGDGWNGNTMTVSQNGITVHVLEMPVGAATSVQVALCDGIPFSLFWNAGGAFAGEVGVSVVDAFGDTIFTKPAGTGVQGTMLFTEV